MHAVAIWLKSQPHLLFPFLPPSHLRKGVRLRRELLGVPGVERADRANKAPSPMEGAATATRGNRRPSPSIGPTLLMGCWVVFCRPDTACGVRTECRSPGAPLLISGAANCVPLRRLREAALGPAVPSTVPARACVRSGGPWRTKSGHDRQWLGRQGGSTRLPVAPACE